MSEGNKPENVGVVRGGDGVTTERRWTTVVDKSGEGRGGRRQFGPDSKGRVTRVNECSREGTGVCFFLFIFFNYRFGPN